MSASRLACIGLLAAWAAAQACLAGTIPQDGTARVYSTVDGDGVTLFTNIPPAHEVTATGVPAAASSGRARAMQLRANGAASHVMTSTAKLQASPQIAPQAGSGDDETALDEIPPQLRDGGAPPEDH